MKSRKKSHKINVHDKIYCHNIGQINNICKAIFHPEDIISNKLNFLFDVYFNVPTSVQ